MKPPNCKKFTRNGDRANVVAAYCMIAHKHDKYFRTFQTALPNKNGNGMENPYPSYSNIIGNDNIMQIFNDFLIVCGEPINHG
jgi:hypothetical protein